MACKLSCILCSASLQGRKLCSPSLTCFLEKSSNSQLAVYMFFRTDEAIFSYWKVIPPPLPLQVSLHFHSPWKKVHLVSALSWSQFFLHLQLISYFKEKQKTLWFSRLPKFNIFSRNSGSVFPKNKSKHLSDIISSLLTLIKISILHPVWAPSSPCGKLSINFIHFKQ